MLKDVGNSVRDAILSCADLLKEESTPGLVAAALFLACGVAIILFANSMFQRRKSLRAVISQIDSQDADQFSTAGFDNVSKWLQDDLKVSKRVGDHLREAWAEFGETLSTDTRFDPPVRCNTVRPAFFFNIEDLGFGPGFYRILPGPTCSGPASPGMPLVGMD